jgi:hypothetical protein
MAVTDKARDTIKRFKQMKNAISLFNGYGDVDDTI